MSNSIFTSFSLSPRHFDTMLDAEMLKNVVLHSVATAFASIVFPVPGGPNSRMPFHGRRIPLKNCGYFVGITTASFSSCFASSSAAMQSHVTFGAVSSMSRWMISASSRISPLHSDSSGRIMRCRDAKAAPPSASSSSPCFCPAPPPPLSASALRCGAAASARGTGVAVGHSSSVGFASAAGTAAAAASAPPPPPLAVVVGGVAAALRRRSLPSLRWGCCSAGFRFRFGAE